MIDAPDYKPDPNLSPLYVSDRLVMTRYGSRWPLRHGYNSSGPSERYYIVGANEDGFSTVANLEAYLATE